MLVKPTFWVVKPKNTFSTKFSSTSTGHTCFIVIVEVKDQRFRSQAVLENTQYWFSSSKLSKNPIILGTNIFALQLYLTVLMCVSGTKGQRSGSHGRFCKMFIKCIYVSVIMSYMYILHPVKAFRPECMSFYTGMIHM